MVTMINNWVLFSVEIAENVCICVVCIRIKITIEIMKLVGECRRLAIAIYCAELKIHQNIVNYLQIYTNH